LRFEWLGAEAVTPAALALPLIVIGAGVGIPTPAALNTAGDSDHPAKAGPAAHFERNEAQGI